MKIFKSIGFLLVVAPLGVGVFLEGVEWYYLLIVAFLYYVTHLVGVANKSIGGGGVSDPTGKSIGGGGVSDPTDKG